MVSCSGGSMVDGIVGGFQLEVVIECDGGVACAMETVSGRRCKGRAQSIVPWAEKQRLDARSDVVLVTCRN